jgi:taurine dioxygenase
MTALAVQEISRGKSDAIDVRPVSGALGAELSGVDLAQDLDDQTFGAIYQALLDHNVIFFRDQDITPEQQIAFAKRFGAIHHHPFVAGLEKHPEIIAITKTETETKNFGGSWHVDQMFCPEPAKITMLYGKEIPAAGGDTLFANLYLAYDGLSPAMQAALADVKTVNIGNKANRHAGVSRADRYGKLYSAMQAKDPGDAVTNAEHPLIRRHPGTGRKCLFIGSHTQQFAGMTLEESEPLLNFLKAHTVKPEYTCRFRWQVGSMAIWDNRCSLHTAVNDYTGSRRVVHRVTIKGDRPY